MITKYMYRLILNLFIFSTVGKDAEVIYDVKIVRIQRTNQKRMGLQMNDYYAWENTNRVEDCGMKVKGNA